MSVSRNYRPAANAAKPMSRREADRRVVLVDQAEIRRKAASACSQEMTRLEKARLEWRRFDREDRPAFHSWMAASFGALLTRVRENGELIRVKELLIREVEVEMAFGPARTYRAALDRVLQRRAQPEAEFIREEPKERPEREDIPEFEQELIFEDFLRTAAGINPDRMSDRRYEQMFSEFQEHVFRKRGNPDPQAQAAAPSSPAAERARIKEIYRVLVRRLHPDASGRYDAEVSALWHEVQEAYGAGNLERLELLLSLTDLEGGGKGERTSLAQMRAVLAELRRAVNALRRSLSEARNDPAWNFTRNPDRATLRMRIQRKLKSELAQQHEHLSELEAQIAAWTAPRSQRRRAVQG